MQNEQSIDINELKYNHKCEVDNLYEEIYRLQRERDMFKDKYNSMCKTAALAEYLKNRLSRYEDCEDY